MKQVPRSKSMYLSHYELTLLCISYFDNQGVCVCVWGGGVLQKLKPTSKVI